MVGLCGQSGLGFSLPAPSLNTRPAGKTIVVWAASTSIGLLTLQLARAAGVEAIAVASERNHPLCQECGATSVFDYHDEAAVVGNVVNAVERRNGKFVGVFDCISEPGSLKFTTAILLELGGGQLNFVLPNVNPDVAANIQVNHVLGRDQDVVIPAWRNFLTSALEQGKLRCVPEPLVVGNGLAHLQEGLDTLRKGVSARKVVVTL